MLRAESLVVRDVAVCASPFARVLEQAEDEAGHEDTAAIRLI